MTQPVLPSDLVGKSIIDLLDARAAARPNAHALTAASAYGGEYRLTYEQLRWWSAKLADGLRQLGIAQGDHVGLMLDNEAGLEAVITMFALHRLGAVVVPINTRFAAEEIVYVVNKARCSALLVASALLATMTALRPRLTAIRDVICVGPAPDGSTDWHAVGDRGRANAGGWPTISPDATSEILFTSGTTAHPKGAVMTHLRTLVSAYGFAAALSLDDTDVYESFFPFFTTASLHCLILPAIWAGAAAVLDPGLDIQAIMRRMERERTTKYIGAPSFYIFLLDAYRPDVDDLSRIRLFDYGGASMSVEVIRQLAATFPTAELRQTYGMTETGPAGTVAVGSDNLAKIGTVGRPWPLTEVRIVGDDGTIQPAGATGEIAVRSPSVMREYFDEPELTKAALRDGWMMTGDIGYIDADGYLFHVDRKKDMIIRGGHNIGSLEVEENFFAHPAVQEAAVVAVPHPKLGEDIHAFIVLRPGATATVDDLRAFLVDRLADYKIPRRISFSSALPRGPMGKILKSELRKHVIEKAAS
ncbi:long-chain acyl-CoA synthetase [Rhodopseudomonas thermotolerans]|uniref:3-methylmercaptopropionyl-CoA ligase n=2 Tax=Rhodopseudomonas TaxID=1073 RepID=A0A336JXV1_9BRAD|nr:MULTISPECIES: class I adenylate-forming enzyme family protein [Rhodopseudomonas]RED29072.1 long-chain acyl-CoA synthetase [Rhodopseudomonas pentothenatexigens]REF92309.1 long-chain acyl-CoA synthetase [Rhodopseudomonas thermotolerans]SSW92484.1 long-chain acyl-CoA synthetase [Rhodopseudomonas pentothenatexigens]